MPLKWPTEKWQLYELGEIHITKFCHLNQIALPGLIETSANEWHFEKVCAYYRPTYIDICLTHCGHPCTNSPGRNWTWPAGVTDREPFGVLCHEIGHHVDILASGLERGYIGTYCTEVRRKSREERITNYCPNDAEWFAEMFRLFLTNSKLLAELRPKTYDLLLEKWIPVVEYPSWKTALGTNCPQRVIQSITNKLRS